MTNNPSDHIYIELLLEVISFVVDRVSIQGRGAPPGPFQGAPT